MVTRNPVGSRIEARMTATEISSYKSPNQVRDICGWGTMLRNTRYARYNLQGLRKRPRAVPHVRFFTVSDVQRRQCFGGMRRSSLVRVVYIDSNRMARHLNPSVSVGHFVIVTAANKSGYGFSPCERRPIIRSYSIRCFPHPRTSTRLLSWLPQRHHRRLLR